MKKVVLFTILIFSFTLTQAQKSKTDSLRSLLQTQKGDTNRVNTLLSLAYLHIAVPDTCLQLSMEAFELSTSLNYKQGINKSLSFMAVAYAYTGNYPQALNCVFKQLKNNEAENDRVAIAGTYNLLGALYREQGNYGEALNYLSKGLSIAQRGNLFLNISETYSKIHVLDSASIYARKGLDIAIQGGSADFLQWAYGRMGATYQDEGKYKLARTYYDSCLSINLKNDLSPWLAYLGLASLYEKTGQLDSSLYYARLCVAKVSQTGLYNAKKKVIPILTSVFEKMHNADSALFYMKLEKAVNDSMFSQQKLGELQSLAFNEKIQEKEKEEAVQKAKETLRNQVIIFSLVGALIVFSAIAFILYRNNKQKQKANRLLQQQKDEIDNKNKELEIESALENVRSRSLAMYKTDELKDVVTIVFEKLQELNIPMDTGALIVISTEDSKDVIHWAASPGLLLSATSFRFPYFDHIINNDFLYCKQNGIDSFSKEYSAEEKNSFWRAALAYSDYKYAPEASISWILEQKSFAMSFALGKNAAILITSYTGILLSEKQVEILKRFSNVFEQAYTRFLDLQRAEAQAREAQIEAALERVRSRSMAMQKSEELREVIQLILDQLLTLHFNIDSASFTVKFNESNDFKIWLAAPGQHFAARIDIPYIDHPLFRRVAEAKKNGEHFFTVTYTKEEKNRFFDHFFKYAPITEERKKVLYSTASWALSAVLMKTVALTIYNYSAIPYSEEQNNTLVRFGKAFEQTYTRFLDLQKAEAAAREAVKQASIDRIRAEIASMRTTKDLDRIIPLIWNELTMLHIPFIRCGVFIVNEEAQQTQVYLSTPEGKAIAAFQLPFNSEGLNKDMLERWRNNQMYKAHWDAAAFSAWTHSLLEAGAIQRDERYSNEQPPENLYLHFVPFMQGMLYVGNTDSLSADELSLIESLADAFSTAYARYDDFSKIEMAKHQIETTLMELKSTQSQLIQKEKMASLGELTAGIAHEIQNPLNFVNNFSELNTELIDELKNELIANNKEEALLIADDIKDNEQKIIHHGKRADSIVKGMLQHSKASSGKKELTNINALVDESLRLSYHGLRAKNKDFIASLHTNFDESIGKINIIPQDISRVLLNLFNNAFYAVNEKKAKLNGMYEPLVSVCTKMINNKAEIQVQDNGSGIAQNITDKIFQPFFTTKPTGEGTGLGLSLSYDIIKAHGGEIKLETKEGEGTEFIITLPTK